MKVYFGAETEQAIREYLECCDEEEKKKIYLLRIQPAFLKLTENIVNYPKFNFKKMDSFQTLQDEVMSHLYSNLGKFNPRKKSKKTGQRVKAFSYFGTMAKNYLVQKSMKREKVSYIYEDNEGNEISIDHNIDLVSDSNVEESIEMAEFLRLLIEKIENNRENFSTDKRKVADAICYFLHNAQKESIQNKKHFYLLMKEYTGLNAKQITVILNDFKKDYNTLRKQYFEETM